MRQSNSYIYFKNRIQEIFNFAVLITVSVPVLKQNIGKYKANLINKLAEPDYFEPSVVYNITSLTIDELTEKNIDSEKIEKLKILIDIELNSREFKEKVIQCIGEDLYNTHRNIIKKQSLSYVNNIEQCSKGYKGKLATYLYFSTFSYFEAFIIDISKEIISSIEKLDQNKIITNPTEEFVSDKIKLSQKFDPRKKDRYLKYSKKIRQEGYFTPKEILFSSLSEILISKIDNLKSNEIPDFLEKTLLLSLTKEEKETFHSLRTNRNSIGHGKNGFTPTLKNVIDANKFFKLISTKVDQHIVNCFFELENYQENE